MKIIKRNFDKKIVLLKPNDNTGTYVVLSGYKTKTRLCLDAAIDIYNQLNK